MGKRNQYSFQKRQRELKKKKKAAEKRARKLGLPLEGEEENGLTTPATRPEPPNAEEESSE
jgi:hypothetical protein